MQSFKLGMGRGTICQKEGVLFLSKMVCKKGKWPDLAGETPGIKLCLMPTPPPPHLLDFCPIKINFALLVPTITFYWAGNGKKPVGSSRHQIPLTSEKFLHTLRSFNFPIFLFDDI